MAPGGGAEEATRGLPFLPTLVLHRICTFLCTHCEPTLPELEGCQDECQGHTTLRNLCQASRLLRFVAEPILYHRAKFKYLAMPGVPDHFASSALRFIQNIQDRPRLRNYVKVLDVRDSARRHRNSDIDFKYFSRHEWSNRRPVTGRNLEYINQLAAPFGITCVADNFVPDRLVETFVQLMLVFLPGLTELKFSAQGCWKFRLLSGALQRKNSKIPDALLSKVRKLRLHFEVPSCRCDECHGSDVRLFERGAEKLLLQATAKNLQTLVCSVAALKIAPDSPLLESLRVDITGDWPFYNNFLAQLKCLRQFSCTFSSQDGPVPDAIMKAITPTAQSLEMLKFCLTAPWPQEPSGWNSLEWEPVGSETLEDRFDLMLISLGKFTKLKCLSIAAEMIFSQTTDRPYTHLARRLERFIGWLPNSLEALHVNTLEFGPDIERILDGLIDALRKNAPCSLHKILISSSDWARFKILRLDESRGSPQWSVRKLLEPRAGILELNTN
ncbi:unnamed protein product [Clonostachys rosea f. rosea IK726]|uniref:Uncharacterized protein n=1 Tax=Clonostachys rosea f. rosea IK726 TaxID=1349383 RepID=A0ACA9U146_BIOOC|nr:unnamed protein product [Clonostachys rosea f. rosea IK726]